MQRSRWQILEILKRKNRATLDELAKELGLVPVTVRAHLSVLQREDLVGAEEVRGKVGRPFYVYYLTEEAERLFPKRYHTLASLILESLEASDGEAKLDHLFERISDSMVQAHKDKAAGKTLEGKVAEAVRILNQDGGMAEWEKTEDGYAVWEHNCPFFLVAQRHPKVCSIDHLFLSKFLGTEVEATHRIVDGHPRCGYHVPAR
ncbi:MAG TPA: metalloregulator ArsR/SmtB family transcription factor [Dehalococcoidia bacterium]|nr:metalloregulator ArsR/SmtB family transcription factor [Dehalococcoidia bacterium]